MKSRGQVLPLWIAGILATMSVMFAALTYGNTLRWQVRAQNAADAAVSGIMAIQTERWNTLEEILYATAVEEYRLRKVLDGMLLATENSGGCNPNSGGGNGCENVYQSLRDQFLKDASRYSSDAQLVHSASYFATKTNWAHDAQALVDHLNAHCFSTQVDAGGNPLSADKVTAQYVAPNGDDCAFTYHIIDVGTRPIAKFVAYDAENLYIPGKGSPPAGVPAGGAPNPELFGPGKIDVIACAVVTPIVKDFGPLHLQPYYVVGHAAATAVMVEQDYLDPGKLQYQIPGSRLWTAFQPPEPWGGNGSAEMYRWYTTDFGGNNATDYPNQGVFSQKFKNPEFSVRMGWWSSVPIRPYSGTTFQPQGLDQAGKPNCSNA